MEIEYIDADKEYALKYPPHLLKRYCPKATYDEGEVIKNLSKTASAQPIITVTIPKR